MQLYCVSIDKIVCVDIIVYYAANWLCQPECFVSMEQKWQSFL